MKVHAVITTRNFDPEWSTFRALHAAGQYADVMGIPGSVNVAADAYSVHGCRNKAVAAFLKTDATHLLFVDNDIIVQQDAIVLLAECDSDIAVGCYACVTRGTNGEWCAPYITVRHGGEWLRKRWSGILRDVEWAGTGCMLIRREVFESITFPWFRWPVWLDEQGDVQQQSDDVDFCKHAIAHGHSIAAHGDVWCSHMKNLDTAVFFNRRWRGPTPRQQPAIESVGWPEEKPDVPCDEQGWFGSADVLRELCGDSTKQIVEVGSWLGQSARWFSEHCPNAQIACVDHWRGSPEINGKYEYGSKLPRLFDTFVANMWDYRERVMPIRMDSQKGMREAKRLGFEPDLVWIDAAHDAASVQKDIETAMELWPDAMIAGDDYDWLGVREGVEAAGIDVSSEGRTWWLEVCHA